MRPGPLIARAESSAVLRDALARATTGRGGLVLLRGEAGIGKSALAAVLMKEAEAAGLSVATGRAWELAEAPPYFPVWPCLRALGIPIPESGADPFRFWELVLGALAQSSNATPVVWLVEDIHAADLQTLDLLTFLAQPLAALRVLVVATARKQDARITERASQRLVRIARDAIDLELPPLTLANVAELAAQIVGRGLSPDVATQLLELTGGNPLFVVECARAFRTAGAASPSVVALPQTVRQVVVDRVALLPEATRRVLAAAAVLGREAAAAPLARMLATLPANVIDAMLPALDAGIVTELRPGDFAFTHILVRNAIEDALIPSERAALHASAEAALATAGDGADVLVERARHALASLRTDGSAVELAVQAATLLEDLGAWDRALAMHQRIEAARRAGLGPSGSMADRLHVADVAQQAGRHSEARTICEEVLAWARAKGDRELFASAALVLGSEIRPGTIDGPLVGALEEARAGLGVDDAASPTALGCRVLARLGAALQPATDPAIPIAIAKRAIKGARAIGDDALLLDVLHVALAAFVQYMPTLERIPLEQELLERALAAQDFAKAVRVQVLLAMDQAELGDFGPWEASVDRALELSLLLGHPRHRWRALLLASTRAVTRGNLAESDRYVVEVRHLAGLTDDPALALALGSHTISIARLLERDDEMRAASLEMVQGMGNVPHGSHIFGAIRAGIYARLEDAAKASDGLAAMNADPVPQTADLFSLYAAEAYALLGDEPNCRRLRAHFEACARLHLTNSIPLIYEGPILRLLGVLDSALGDHATAEARLRDVLASARSHGHRLWAARVGYELGRALVRGGKRSEAAAELEQATALAQELGMPDLVTRSRRVLASIAVAAPARAPQPPKAPDEDRPLSMAREGDTWRIDYAGRVVRVKDSRGLQLLARLVDRPGEEVHVLVLASDEGGSSLHDTGTGDVLDARARREFKARLDDLASEIASAEQDNDLGRLARMQREKATIESDLERAFGLRGKARPEGSASERARVNVQRRLKDAIARVGEQDPAAGRFFEQSVRTGTYCRFSV